MTEIRTPCTGNIIICTLNEEILVLERHFYAKTEFEVIMMKQLT
jgi:hypothetical protein